MDWNSVALDLALIFAMLLYSERPALYTVFSSMYIDSRCREVDLGQNDPGVMDIDQLETSTKLLVALGSIRDYSGGITLALGIESRSYGAVSSSSQLP
jgi:hypothetical protein